MASRRIAGVLILVLAAAPSSVGADSAGWLDGQDTPGRLDIRAVAHAHADDGRVTHRVGTHGPWRSKLLEQRHSEVTVWFSTDREERFAEFRATIDFRDGRLVACLGPYDEISDGAAVGPCRRIHSRRPDREAVVIAFDPARLGDPRAYQWSASTSYASRDSNVCSGGRNTCHDYSPREGDRGQIRHRL